MSSWRGFCAALEDVIVGLPHMTKIARKPKGVGAEIKTMACGETRIMLALEIQEGKTAMRAKPFAADLGAGTSSLLRLTTNYVGSAHVVVADSAFASVKTAAALHELRGMGFIGLVKTATRQFPTQYLSSHPLPTRGSHAVLQATVP